ncbi:hypothetical protein HYH03_012505 [Edaphochlamys debaryana]|uniref:CNH domain-containing protein n=1 Tax=Edaphochlamys debaryana TaxID=47281 RepID=A0A836BVJ3_9CHLO|nr:hypothetical protein HYH03_012505 [Edaphochlamys debaryana]|eukprot:KAG2489069.1 hypothetical protein HYH03_012505 [Edaphochlamys debaryana]
MQEDAGRTAFTFAPVLRHRTTDPARRITAVALDTAAGRLFLGLASGHVEEHQLIVKEAHVQAAAGWHGTSPAISAPAASCRLLAERRVSRHAISALAPLPTAARLAIMCEGGAVVLAAYDTWALSPLPGVRSATAVAADPGPAFASAAAAAAAAATTPPGTPLASKPPAAKPPAAASASATAVPGLAPRPVRLAVSVKGVAAATQLLVYSVTPSVGFAANFAASQPPASLLAQVALPEPVTELTWLAGGLLAVHPSSYALVQPGGRYTRIAEHGCTRPRIAAAPVLPPASSPSTPTTPGATPSASAPTPPAPSSNPHAPGALLFADRLLLLTDASGTAAAGCEPLALPGPPLALAVSGPCLIAVLDSSGSSGPELGPGSSPAGLGPGSGSGHPGSGLGRGISNAGTGADADADADADVEGLLVVDRASGRPLQRIPWAHDDPWVASAGRLPLGEDAAGGGCVALAAAGGVALLSPVQPDVQAHELLKRRRFAAALPLIRRCRAEGGGAGAAWADTALAQAGLLLLQELRFPEGLAALEEAGPAAFQPCQLCPLLPGPMGRWLQGVPRRGYWGLGGQGLASLDRLIADHLELRAATQARTGPGPAGAPAGPTAEALAAEAVAALADYLLRSRLKPGILLPEAVDALTAHLLLRGGPGAVGRLEAFLGQEAPPGSGSGSASGSGSGPDGEGEGEPAEAAGRGEADGWQVVGAGRGPTSAPATAAGGAGAGVGPGSALSSPRAVAVAAASGGPGAAGGAARVSARDPELVAALQGASRWHALALLRSARGAVPAALELWQRLALGEAQEGPAATGAVAEAASSGSSGGGGQGPAWAAATVAVAAAASARLMAAEGRVPPLLCLSKLPWMLAAAPQWALHVLRSRPLPVVECLALLRGRTDGVRWQYLHHLVYGMGGTAAASAVQQAAAAATGAAAGSGAAAAADGGDGGAAAAEALTASLHTELALELVEVAAAAAAEAAAEVTEADAGAEGDAAAGASTTTQSATAAPASASAIAPAEAPWLATLGLITDAAAARVLSLAARGARAAAAGGGGGGSGSGSLALLKVLTPRGEAAGGGVGGGGGPTSLAGLRAVLQHHMYDSKLYDAGVVLQALAAAPAAARRALLRESVMLHARAGDAAAALAALVGPPGPGLGLGDVEGGIAFCRRRCGPEGWRALLELLLRPGEGREPDFRSACRVLAAEGAELAPLQVLEALGDSMPLAQAHATLAALVGSVQHRKRQGQVLRALHRAQNLALRAELAALQAQRSLVGEETLCRGCQRPLSTRVVSRLPSGVLLCGRCVSASAEAGRQGPGPGPG